MISSITKSCNVKMLNLNMMKRINCIGSHMDPTSPENYGY